MRLSILLASLLVLVILLTSVAEEEPSRVLREGPETLDPRDCRIGERVADIPFTGAAGASGTLADAMGEKGLVVLFFSPQCPLSKKYAPRAARLVQVWRERGFGFLVVSANPVVEGAEFQSALARYGIEARGVMDPDGLWQRQFRATRTTDAFCLDAARTLVYRGAIDDQYGLGYAREKPVERYLVSALEAIERGDAPLVEATKAPGCEMAETPWPESAPPTYHARVSRILQRHCQACHRPGQSGPFSLRSYKDASGVKDMVERVVREGIMPPWHASADSRPCANDARLPARDRQAILDWIAAGCPEGDPRDAPLPVKFPEGWQIGQPDVVYTTPAPFQVPAEGVLPYLYMQVDTRLAEDRWVQAIEVRATAPEVVHHVLVFIRYPKGHPRYEERPRFQGGLQGFFAGLTPGQGHMVFPPGMAKFLPRGAQFIFQIHYTPIGESMPDQPKLGIIFAKTPPRYEIHTEAAFAADFAIPPGAEAHEVQARYTFKEDAVLLGVTPHMHVRGKAFRYDLELPGATNEPLLSVPAFDFNWQLTYILKDPIPVAKGTHVHATAWYDNSKGNPANPDPTKTVHFGEQTWEEMMIGYIHFYRERTDLTPAADETRGDY